MASYWKCDKPTSLKIKELREAYKAERKQWQKYAESIGADTAVLGTAWLRDVVVGFRFKLPPLRKFFYSHKHDAECWVPRAGTDPRKAMDKMQSVVLAQICDLIGFDWFGGDGSITRPGINFKGDSCYIILNDNSKPKRGCTRISDLTFQRLFSKKRKAKKQPCKR